MEEERLSRELLSHTVAVNQTFESFLGQLRQIHNVVQHQWDEFKRNTRTQQLHPQTQPPRSPRSPLPLSPRSRTPTPPPIRGRREEREREEYAHGHSSNPRVKLNVGGTIFETTERVLLERESIFTHLLTTNHHNSHHHSHPHSHHTHGQVHPHHSSSSGFPADPLHSQAALGSGGSGYNSIQSHSYPSSRASSPSASSTMSAYSGGALSASGKPRNGSLVGLPTTITAGTGREGDGDYFIDRSPDVFSHILEYFRTGHLLESSDLLGWQQQMLARDIEFYCIKPLLEGNSATNLTWTYDVRQDTTVVLTDGGRTLQDQSFVYFKFYGGTPLRNRIHKWRVTAHRTDGVWMATASSCTGIGPVDNPKFDNVVTINFVDGTVCIHGGGEQPFVEWPSGAGDRSAEFEWNSRERHLTVTALELSTSWTIPQNGIQSPVVKTCDRSVKFTIHSLM
eukprot:TRINITY_DN30081_c0_g1_i1.p1 TRINITY_DN30081_c0_g1~~TRINITY_DN30081_c0_g1_i1.p1  ORF type:complete len:452 (-),score=5.49 TRINITY_DN30081_c0_g1_i1:205-1560(-)